MIGPFSYVLLSYQMLSEGIMHECLIRLLRFASDEESLECFCVLITVTGKLLDRSEAKRRIDQYFQRISDIIEKKKISSRIKFKLQDVQDLRKVLYKTQERREKEFILYSSLLTMSQGCYCVITCSHSCDKVVTTLLQPCRNHKQ